MIKKIRSLNPGVLAILLFLTFFFLPDTSHGHAYPDHADPKVGSTISLAPKGVRIWFDSDLEPMFSTITVQDASGKRIDMGDGRVDPADPMLLEVSLPPLPSGIYQVFWNVVARDTHRTTGNFTFTIK